MASVAETLRNVGFTLSTTSLMDHLLKLTSTVVVAIAIFVKWPSTELSTTIVAFVQEATGCRSIPHLALAWLLFIWFVLIQAYVLSVSLTKGYNNSAPRTIVTDGRILRTKWAIENTMESLLHLVVALTIMAGAGSDLSDEDKEKIAKWAMLSALARTAYPVFYVMDIDVLRTLTFAVGMFSYIGIILTSL